MGKIGDLIVRLKLKSEDYEKGLKKVEKKTSGLGESFGKLKATTLAVWAAIGAAVVKFASDMKNKTQSIGDAWAVTTAKMNAAWNVFLEGVTNGFDGFGAKMREAEAAAEEYAKAMDANFEVQNAFKLQRAEMSRELATLEIIARDINKTFEERLKAIEDFRTKQGRLYNQIADQAKYLEGVTFRKFIAGGNLPDTEQVRADLKKLLTTGFTDRELLDALGTNIEREESLEYVKDATKSMRMWGVSTPEADTELWESVPVKVDLNKWQKDYKTDLLELYRLYNNYRKDEEAMQLVDSMLATWDAEAAEEQNTKRIQNLENSLKHQQEEAARKAKEEAARKAKAIDEAILEADQELNRWLDEILNEPIEIELEPIEFDFTDTEKQIDEFLEGWRKDQEEIEMLNKMFEDSMVSSISGGMQALTDMLVGIENADASKVLAALLQPFASTMVQLGEILLAEGLAIEVFKSSLSSLNGTAAIAAGIGLIALGSALGSAIQALGSSSMSSAASTSAADSSSGGLETYDQEITVYVTGEISGDKIILSGQKTLNKWKR